jgi:hypothetical protein
VVIYEFPDHNIAETDRRILDDTRRRTPPNFALCVFLSPAVKIAPWYSSQLYILIKVLGDLVESGPRMSP